MRNTQGKPMAAGSAIALGLAMSWSWSAPAAGSAGATAVEVATVAASSRAPEDRWNTFSAVVTIRRGAIDANQRPLGDREQAVRYAWERRESGGRWKTIVTPIGSLRPEVVTPAGTQEPVQPDIIRIEDDGDGIGPRLYTRFGTIVRPPTVKDRRQLSADESIFASTDALLRDSPGPASAGLKTADGGRDWIDAVLPTSGRTDARRAALQRRFGGSAGQLRGLDRYVLAAGRDTTELLVDGAWAVPLELNILRGGQLQSHSSFTYEAGPRGSVVRRASRVERVLADGTRTSLDVELSGVNLEDRR